MKTRKALFVLAAALLTFAACQKAEMADPAASPLPEAEGLVTATIEETGTKVYLNNWDGQIYRVEWEGSESISLFRGNGSNLCYNFYDYNGSSSSAIFAPDQDHQPSSAQEFDYDVAVFPYFEDNSARASGDKVQIGTHLYDTFEYGYNFPMVAVNRKDASSNFVFKNVLGGLIVYLTGYAEITSVEFRGNGGEIIAGPATITVGPDAIPSIELTEDGYTSVTRYDTVKLDGSSEGWYIFGLPPMTFEKGITLTITDSMGNKWTKTSETPLAVERSVMNYVYLEYPYVDEEIVLDGVYTSLGAPDQLYSTPDDYGFIMTAFCNDLEGPDAYIPNSAYNWFGVCGEYSSRNGGYRNLYLRYQHPVNLIQKVNSFLPIFENNAVVTAQLRTLRAFAYMQLAQDYQFPYSVDPSAPAVPILPEDGETTEVARSSVAEVYRYIKADLDYACDALAGYARPSKKYIDRQVALGLRARAGLLTGDYQAAYADALAAAEGYSPATIEEVSKPSFMDISEHNWIWCYDMTPEIAFANRYATTSSWLRSFSAWSYSAGAQVYTCINSMLYDKIADTDVRKGWWVDENLESPLLEGLTWNGNGDVATYEDWDAKTEFLPYTNVKFGCNPIATTENAEDFPFMRVEEMILVQAEAAARLGNEAQARQILSSFVMGYRQPDYTTTASGEALLDEIWRQRRIELWGEGFGVLDVRRLGKPLVRFHGEGTSSQPGAYAFNLAADDGWLLLRFPNRALEANPALVDNDGGSEPVPGQNPDLRDGVTD